MENDNHLDTSNTNVFNNLDMVAQTDIDEKPVLGEVFTQERSLQENVTEYRCDVCRKTFSSEREVFTHKEIHSKEKHYQCEEYFVSVNVLGIHQRKHAQVKPLGCEICSNNSSLIIHVCSHTSEKPFHCEMLKKSYSGNPSLIVHKRIHPGKKAYHCEICGECFCQKSKMTLHKYSHTGKKPFYCDICGKCFWSFSVSKICKRTRKVGPPFTIPLKP
eukprot:XP_014789413.1 PREDICTED: zinc finger protein 239-like [Octopus bimaculoides]